MPPRDTITRRADIIHIIVTPYSSDHRSFFNSSTKYSDLTPRPEVFDDKDGISCSPETVSLCRGRSLSRRNWRMAPVATTFDMAADSLGLDGVKHGDADYRRELSQRGLRERTQLTYKGRVLGLFSVEEMTVSNFIL